MRALLACLVLALGCGGLDPQFAGTWIGTLVVTVGAESATPFVGSTPNARVTIEEVGGVYSYLGCGGMAGPRLRLEGAGDSASWHGVQSCALPTDNCPTGTVIWRSANATLTPGPTLKATLNGTGASCGYSPSMAIEFNGSK